jgi:hypothetical protein
MSDWRKVETVATINITERLPFWRRWLGHTPKERATQVTLSAWVKAPPDMPVTLELADVALVARDPARAVQTALTQDKEFER